MDLGKFCEACQAIPQIGYCKLAGCPMRPSATPMDFETCLERLASWATAYAVELEEDGATGTVDQINRDQLFMRGELDWSDMQTRCSNERSAAGL